MAISLFHLFQEESRRRRAQALAQRAGIGPLTLTAPPEFSAFEIYDADAGIVNVPNTGAFTILHSLTVKAPFFCRYAMVTVYDPAAVNVMTWRLSQNGIILGPWDSQRLKGASPSVPVEIGRLIPPGAVLTLEAQVPTTAVGGFDAVGNLVGDFLRRNEP